MYWMLVDDRLFLAVVQVGPCMLIAVGLLIGYLYIEGQPELMERFVGVFWVGFVLMGAYAILRVILCV
jgi:hypothetical protein